MKPYLGILIDSFWEAVGNKVLWAALIGWSLILGGLAPFGYVSDQSYQLTSGDIADRTQLIERLAENATGKGPKSGRAIVAKLDPDFLELVASATKEGGPGTRRIRSSELAKQLNNAVIARDLYTEEDFPKAKRRKRLVPLIETPGPELGEADLEQLNRELMQLAYPIELNPPRGEKLWIGYAGFKIGNPLPTNRRQIRQFLEPVFLGLIIKFGLAVLAVFLAIIVTSPMIPDTFRSGSLHLMLSKPISRVWLYLSKFFGGCVFVLVNITFVLTGLYLIAGLRFDIWNSALFACIPLLLFVFIIFYTVSGLAGLVWGNAIVSVVACMVFWLFCFSIGFIHDVMMPHVEVFPQIASVRTIDDHLVRINEQGDFGIWNDEFSVWQPAIDSESRGQRAKTFGPIYDAKRKEVLVKSFVRVPFVGLVARSRKIDMIDLEPEQSESAKEENQSESSQDSTPTNLTEARKNPVWVTDPGPEFPRQLRAFFRVGDSIVAVCRGGLFRLDLDQLETIETNEKGLFGIKIPWLAESAFKNIAPEDYFLSDQSYAAPTAAGNGIAILNSGTVDYLELRDGAFELLHSNKLDGDGLEVGLLQMNANYCVVARDDLPLEILDKELKSLRQVDLPDEAKAKQLAWVPDTNDLAIITHTGDFLRLACGTGTIEEFDAPFAGEYTCMDWTSESELYLGVKPNRVYAIDLKTGKTKQALIPKSTTLETIFGWGIKPLYTVMPKPAALDNAMGFLLSGSKTQSMNLITADLEAAQVKLEIWPPILSNLAFVVFMLGLSSIYISRKEF